jgi:hypothetical protein
VEATLALDWKLPDYLSIHPATIIVRRLHARAVTIKRAQISAAT